MKRLVFLFCGYFILQVSFGQSGNNNIIRKGNEKYHEGNFEESAKIYSQALENNKNDVHASFNLGDALYRQGNFKESSGMFESVAENMKNPKEKSKAYHNLGNTYLQEKDYQKSLDAFKQALLADPSNKDARHNYEYARQKLQQQQQQQKNQKNDKNKDDKNKDNKDGKDPKKDNKDGDKGDKGEKDKKDENKDGENKEDNKGDKKDENKDKGEQGNKGDKKDESDKQPSGMQPHQISKENAQRLLDALLEKENQEQLNMLKERKKQGGQKIEKDW